MDLGMFIFILMAVIFVIGYTLIALEHPLQVNKSATALITGTLLWTLLALFYEPILKLNFSPYWLHAQEMAKHIKQYIEGHIDHETFKRLWEHYVAMVEHPREFIINQLEHHLIDIAEILFFLLGAMTIVETVDRYQGFRLITDHIKTKSKVKLIWILSWLTFFMSAVLDNLTTTIVMLALLNKLIKDKQTRWIYASIIVIAANSGGAFSPIGDVTTIMLWINGNVTASKIIAGVFLPSAVSLLVPLAIISFMLKGKIEPPEQDQKSKCVTTPGEQKLLLILGVGGLVFVPIFKTFTHLPPYIGMLLSLSVIWITTELLLHRKLDGVDEDRRSKLSVIKILSNVDVPTIFFFLGILTAVTALQTAGHLDLLAAWLDKATHTNIYLIDTAIGLLSSIVDNVPLTAAAMGMYPIADPAIATGHMVHFVQDGLFWELLAYTAGTGGSILIIGSAAGVAAMGIEKIDFIWYLKKISWIALLGYLAGIGTYALQEMLFHTLH